MSILVNADDRDDSTQMFSSEKDWLVGKAILSNEDDSALSHIFDMNQRAQSENSLDLFDRSQQVERIHSLSQHLIQKPNRTCLSDAYQPVIDPTRMIKPILRSIIPSQNTLFELAQDKPDNSRWTLTFPEDENIPSDDDGFQSASSTISEEKAPSTVSTVHEVDVWTRALTQDENRYFTWEQRGSYLYHRTRPFLFDFRLDDRPFQHLCLLLLLTKPPTTLALDFQYRPISVQEFLRDLCYMLMSISSQTFVWSEIDQTFEFQSDVYVLGYTQTIIQSFSQRYIQAGNQFHRIQHYVNQSVTNLSETENIFCQALRYYLRVIQNSITIHDITKYSLVKFAAQLDPIICSLNLPLSIISTIGELEQTVRTSSPSTSIAFVKLSSILHTLLNHRYHSIDQNYFLLLIHWVIYSLRPLLSFLTDLIIHSTYRDRYNEYPILFNNDRLMGLKITEFWTRTFTIRYLYANNTDTIFHQILPIEYLQQIVNITRSLLLLKLCDKNHPLCLNTTKVKPKLKFIHINSVDRDDENQLKEYEREMQEKISEYERAQKQKRIDAEQAKVQERMDMYARQDQERAERKKLADDKKEALMKSKQALRDQWQEQVDTRRKQLKEEKLAESLADAEINQRPSATTTIIGSRLATPYTDLVQSVREEIISEYDAKMRDAGEREEQFRKRIQPDASVETPKQAASSSTVSSDSSVSFHTPADDQSPMINPPVETKPSVVDPPTTPEKTDVEDVIDLKPIVTKAETSPTSQPIIRHTATEETKQAEYRSTVKMVPSRVLQSTIQNYMMDHDPADDTQDDEEPPEKVYDWETIIANGPQFHYKAAFDLTIGEKNVALSKGHLAESWSDLDLSPLRVWLAHSISPLIHVQSQLVNRALLNYFFDELDLLDHLNNLRAFYFLATGRFGLGFCSELSRILLSTEDARTIYHVNSMRQILYTSLDQTGQLTRFIDLLQLKTKTNLPNSLSLLDSTLLDYYDLLYDIQWPMNIVISQEMLEKYQLIFRFLLRILIVKQVLNEIWVMLKACKQQNATLSQLHLYRHQMQHFITVLINYITNQVIQIAWNEFIVKIQRAKHINEIAAAHNEYLDRTMLNCLLTPNAAPIFNEVNRVLTLIIRFRCQLKTFSWLLDAAHTDPSDSSAQALRTTFEKYQIAVLSLFKVLSKLVEKGYKTSLADLLIRLNHNGYYDRLATLSGRRLK